MLGDIFERAYFFARSLPLSGVFDDTIKVVWDQIENTAYRQIITFFDKNKTITYYFKNFFSKIGALFMI